MTPPDPREPAIRAALSEDDELVGALTRIVRQADQDFQRVGGSSRHWTRDCFLPALNAAGYVLVPAVLKALPQWEPIATCPKDGRHFLIATEYGGVLVANINAFGVLDVVGKGTDPVTHWMPLPAPPVPEEPR